MFDVRHTAAILFQLLTSSHPLPTNIFFFTTDKLLRQETGGGEAERLETVRGWRATEQQKQSDKSVRIHRYHMLSAMI